MKTDLFQSCGYCCVFQICWHIECSTFTASPLGFEIVSKFTQDKMHTTPKQPSHFLRSLLSVTFIYWCNHLFSYEGNTSCLSLAELYSHNNHELNYVPYRHQTQWVISLDNFYKWVNPYSRGSISEIPKYPKPQHTSPTSIPKPTHLLSIGQFSNILTQFIIFETHPKIRSSILWSIVMLLLHRDC